ncbi:hypothetical protein [Lawsonibacter faecis]|uniref:Uncharacterized protein n=1 Tax=Lawsonibacter faecis TaxID=2763052 RepID=A0A8J6JJ07_9FIRM|nr:MULTISPECIES: hypothetical protein [Oscillospiraceae]MTQ95978.1 hypothetical protein [Pseudoflavonifractor sp. BIOML-A16]MTR04730.1 hypothetical protein [Pseudoflavonifractor sp. BIOML-A15]MTR31022.1 hypothetical protein [Pseudoflavonifractor sp. BIOML-A14]MTR71587.1 hypothetical protein [Pseudoflavonifractor sp. BIOML-A18]MTS62870.1 hypothetical protein [Pseudoflavonifractor sp. BIOML-A5]MTS71536.1 hypothetical protein [Pseudoflavonifractor sp. BIOML-A8]MTS91132.1 hypothetical protein [P
MVINKKFRTVQELKRFSQLACSVPEPVYLQDEDARNLVAAESIINLFTLDYSRPVRIITDSPVVAEAMDHWEQVCPAFA